MDRGPVQEIGTRTEFSRAGETWGFGNAPGAGPVSPGGRGRAGRPRREASDARNGEEAKFRGAGTSPTGLEAFPDPAGQEVRTRDAGRVEGRRWVPRTDTCRIPRNRNRRPRRGSPHPEGGPRWRWRSSGRRVRGGRPADSGSRPSSRRPGPAIEGRRTHSRCGASVCPGRKANAQRRCQACLPSFG